MFANAPFISDADYDVFEGPRNEVTGQALFDLNHRFGMAQIATNWQEAHPGAPELQAFTLSNRLANIKKRINRETGRSIKSLGTELEAALAAVGYKKNGKHSQTRVPYPPRIPARTVAAPGVPTPAAPAPTSAPITTAFTTAGPSTTSATAKGGGNELAGSDNKDATNRASGQDKNESMTDPSSDDGELSEEEEGPRRKRAKIAASAPSKEASEDGEPDCAVQTVGAVEGDEDDSGGAKENDDSAGQDEGAEEAGGADGARRMIKYGGAIELTPGDPQSIAVASEFDATKQGASIIRSHEEDINLAPPHPRMSQTQYHNMGLEGVASLSPQEAAQLRKNWEAQM